MDFKKFLKNYADEINGQFQEYDNAKSVIIVPLPDERFQTVIGEEKESARYKRNGIELTSKVCKYRKDIDLKRLLEEHCSACHAKFVIKDDFLQVEASAFVDNINSEIMKEMIQEVANLADEYEFILTGADVH